MSISIYIPKNPHEQSIQLASDLNEIIPDSQVLQHGEHTEGIHILIHQDIGPQFVILKTPTVQIVFKLIEYKTRERMQIKSKIKKEKSQLVLTNFLTDLGCEVAEVIMEIFPCDTQSRQVVNFAVHGEFVFFRMYKYCFSDKGPLFEKIGPHLTLRLWRMVKKDGEEKVVLNFEKFVCNQRLLG